MDSGNEKPKARSKKESSRIAESLCGFRRTGEDEEEKIALLAPLEAPKGAIVVAGRKKKRSRRKVQWNDRNGKKLAQVLEFLPSDSSDSEDESLDPCYCSMM